MCGKAIDAKCHPELRMHFIDIPCAPYGSPGTVAIIDQAIDYLKTRDLVLLANHGVLAIGSSLEKAYDKIAAAEKFAKMLCITKLIGPVKDLDEGEVRALDGTLMFL